MEKKFYIECCFYQIRPIFASTKTQVSKQLLFAIRFASGLIKFIALLKYLNAIYTRNVPLNCNIALSIGIRQTLGFKQKNK